MWFLIDYRDERGKSIEEHENYPPFGDWSSCSPGYASREELIKGQGIPLEPCKECGEPFGTNYVESTKARQLEHNLCFGCLLWTERMNDPINNPDRYLIAEHKFYSIADENMKGPRGFGGSRWTFKRISDDKIITSTNVWYGGDIPEHFWDRIPDTATIIRE